jgi:hypothetical protein
MAQVYGKKTVIETERSPSQTLPITTYDSISHCFLVQAARAVDLFMMGKTDLPR